MGVGGRMDPVSAAQPRALTQGSLAFTLLPGAGLAASRGASHLNEGEVAADDFVLLPGCINLSSVGLGGEERAKGKPPRKDSLRNQRTVSH